MANLLIIRCDDYSNYINKQIQYYPTHDFYLV